MPGEPTRAVFLSYASQDAEAARRLCDALRSGGIEVWFDADGGLEHGDEWDAKIRRQIKECVLFLPIISANTQAREEGYFRLEWDLAAERARTIASGVPFILPVVIDDTREPDALVPDRFRTVQWTRLPGGVVTPEVKARYLKLWSHRIGVARARATAGEVETKADRAPNFDVAVQSSGRKPLWWVLVLLATGVAVGGYLMLRPQEDRRPAAAVTAPGEGATGEARQLVERARLLYEGAVGGNLRRDDFVVAETLLKRALELAPLDPHVWAAYSVACSLMYGNRFDDTPARKAEARSAADKAVRLAPESGDAWIALARAYRYDAPLRPEARRILLEWKQRLPGHPLLLETLAWTYFADGQRDEALAALDELPDDLALKWATRANMLSVSGRRQEAEIARERALALSPDSGPVRINRIKEFLLEGKLDAAREELGKLPPAFLLEERGAYYAAQVWLWSSRPEKCLELLDTFSHDVIGRGPRVPKTYFTGLAHALAGRAEAAQAEWRLALTIGEKRLGSQRNDHEWLQLRTELLAMTGQDAEAEKALRLAMQLAGSRENRWFRARVLAWMGRGDEAIALLEPVEDRRAELRYSPAWLPLRKHPRFPALLVEKTSESPLSGGPGVTPAAGSPANPASQAEAKSVAVLPFANQSDDKANESFADGISEELGVVLSKVPGLRVTGWNSALSFKGKSVPEAEIAQKLGVTHIVSGSVLRSGTQVRITARLVNAADGFSLWSESFRREAKDIFAVQDEIAGLIAQNLQLKLGVETRRTRTVNPEAHRLMLEGRHFWNQRNEAGFARAETAFRQAIDLDPTLAEAHTGLAGVYVIRAIYQQKSEAVTRDSEDMRRARVAASRAVELDPALAEAHAVLAFVRMSDRDNAAAQRSFEQALQLSPNSATAHSWYGVFLLINGRIDRALERYARAAELDPLWFINLQNLTESLFYAGRYEEALRVSDRATTLRSDPFIPHVGLRAQILLALGRRDEAVQLARTLRTNPAADTRWIADAAAIRILNLSGQTSEAQAYAAEVLARIEPRSAVRAQVLAALGRHREAIPHLDQARAAELRYIFYEPLWDPCRHEPEFGGKIAQLGCAAEYKIARDTLVRLTKPAETKP